jgi:hypothetical protein
MPLPTIPQSEALVPLAAPPTVPFPDEVPEDLFLGIPMQERRFVLRYLEHGNAARAYEESGMQRREPTHPASPASYAWFVLRRPRIQAALARIQAFYAYHTGLHAWQILGTLHTQAMLDPAPVYEGEGATWALKPMGEWPLHIRLCVQKVSIKEWESDGGIKRQIDVEFTDRQHALFMLGKHLKLYEKKDRQIAPFTLVLNTQAPEAPDLKKVGEVIEGIGLQIQMPEAPAAP